MSPTIGGSSVLQCFKRSDTMDPNLSEPQISGCSDYLVWNFDCSKPEEADIRRLFALTMDNMTGKETAVLTMKDLICLMIHISGYFA